jgi:beta-lactamase superfamily II metal-dependent hydrolase
MISLFTFPENSILFTGDAGVPAINAALDKAQELGIPFQAIKWIQIPHHGRKRNVGPSVLNKLLGPKRQYQTFDRFAYVSASKEGEPKHPAKKVVNALIRRGCKVYSTQGQTLHHGLNAPERGWGEAKAFPFYTEVDE